MKVVILAGGLGTRLGKHTETLPKPMVPIGRHPILYHIMSCYAHYGHNEFILCLGYKHEVIRDYFIGLRRNHVDLTVDLSSESENSIRYHGDQRHDWKVTLAYTGQQTMTGARIKRIEKYLDNDDEFLCTYGDGLSDLDINELIDFHRANDRIGTLTAVHPPARFGNLDATGTQVTRFQEKAAPEQSWINGGFYVFNREFLRYLSHDASCVLEKSPLESLASDQQLTAYHHAGYWQCMDTARDLEALTESWTERDAAWKVWEAPYAD